MMSKKIKRGLGIIFMTAGLLAGSITVSAASYVQSNMPGDSSISCWGSIGFSGNTMTATTSSNGGSKIRRYNTYVTGVLTINGSALGEQYGNGTISAKISSPGVNGYRYGRGTHQASTNNNTWTGYTNM